MNEKRLAEIERIYKNMKNKDGVELVRLARLGFQVEMHGALYEAMQLLQEISSGPKSHVCYLTLLRRIREFVSDQGRAAVKSRKLAHFREAAYLCGKCNGVGIVARSRMGYIRKADCTACALVRQRIGQILSAES
jgi:hypothetical protein